METGNCVNNNVVQNKIQGITILSLKKGNDKILKITKDGVIVIIKYKSRMKKQT